MLICGHIYIEVIFYTAKYELSLQIFVILLHFAG